MLPSVTAVHIGYLCRLPLMYMDPLSQAFYLLSRSGEPWIGWEGSSDPVLLQELPLLQHVGPTVRPPAPIPALDEPPSQLIAAEAALLEMADPSLDSRISLIGPNTLELLCALLRRGCADVCATRVCDWPQAGTADVAIIPGASSPDHLKRSIAHARRVLAPLGTIALHLAASPADALTRQASQLLLLHGFTGLRRTGFPGGTLIRAELPLHGGLACA